MPKKGKEDGCNREAFARSDDSNHPQLARSATASMLLARSLLPKGSRQSRGKHYVVRFSSCNWWIAHIAVAEAHLPAEPLRDFGIQCRMECEVVLPCIGKIGVKIKIFTQRCCGAELALEILAHRRAQQIP